MQTADEIKKEIAKMYQRKDMENYSCLSYWFPKLRELDINLPNTIFIKINKQIADAALEILYDGKIQKGHEDLLDSFFKLMKEKAKLIGYPLFLRSGQTSNKHDWKDSCFVESEKDLIKHFWNIVEFSQIVDFVGLPINVWVFREIIETRPRFYFFKDMPITTEYRFFFNDNKYVCHHPYWPEGAFKNCKDIKSKLTKLYQTDKEEIELLKKLTNKVAKSFDGYWSVDWLRAKNGDWYLTDMADGYDSYHWPNCKFKLER